jgi:hypothetical protein
MGGGVSPPWFKSKPLKFMMEGCVGLMGRTLADKLERLFNLLGKLGTGNNAIVNQQGVAIVLMVL